MSHYLLLEIRSAEFKYYISPCEAPTQSSMNLEAHVTPLPDRSAVTVTSTAAEADERRDAATRPTMAVNDHIFTSPPSRGL